MANSTEAKLQALMKPTIEGLGYEWVGCEYHLQRPAILRVYIDAEGGVTLDGCAEVSRQLGALLDVEDIIEGGYQLEVSSPGLERPLFTEADFERFTGRQANIQLKAPLNGRRRFKGEIVGIKSGNINLVVDGQHVSIPFAEVAKAKLIMTD